MFIGQATGDTVRIFYDCTAEGGMDGRSKGGVHGNCVATNFSFAGLAGECPKTKIPRA